MKKMFIVCALTLSLSAMADIGKKESHGNPEEEAQCSKEVQNLGCGSPEKSGFLTCVSSKLSLLSQTCQKFHMDEIKRNK